MAETGPFWGRKTYCLITGASQGIGREIAIQFAQKVAAESVFLLLARDLNNLKKTQQLMEEANPSVHVLTHSVNLSDPIAVELRKVMGLSLTTFNKEISDFDVALIVHNAGTLGDLTEHVTEMRNVEKIESYFRLNLVSVMVLTAEFIKVFDCNTLELAFVNITSLCGIKPFPSMGYYCMGKSVREMYFGVLAEENKNFTVLNYSPGPVLTDMTDLIIKDVKNDEIKATFTDMRNGSKLLTVGQTIGRLSAILDKRAFKNGGRVDYYDDA